MVVIQMIVAIAIINLVSRKDSAPSLLVILLDGIFGRMLYLSDMPLIGQVRLNIIKLFIKELYLLAAFHRKLCHRQ